jgi:hypothetical protein
MHTHEAPPRRDEVSARAAGQQLPRGRSRSRSRGRERRREGGRRSRSRSRGGDHHRSRSRSRSRRHERSRSMRRDGARRSRSRSRGRRGERRGEPSGGASLLASLPLVPPAPQPRAEPLQHAAPPDAGAPTVAVPSPPLPVTHRYFYRGPATGAVEGPFTLKAFARWRDSGALAPAVVATLRVWRANAEERDSCGLADLLLVAEAAARTS